MKVVKNGNLTKKARLRLAMSSGRRPQLIAEILARLPFYTVTPSFTPLHPPNSLFSKRRGTLSLMEAGPHY